jgi:Protein of unknown function (DUF1453)
MLSPMPLLLIIPLLLLALVALWAVLLPFSLWMRYRTGRARRRAQGWVIRGNAWLLLASLGVFAGFTAFSALWLPHALRDGAIGVLAGLLLGIASLRLTRFEPDAGGFYYTPNRWLVLALTIAVAARLVASLWMGWRRVFGEAEAVAADAWLQAGSLVGVAALLLGYYLAYTWGLRARVLRGAERSAGAA